MKEYPNVVVFKHPLIDHKITHLCDKNTSTKEFRETVSELAMLMGFEAFKDLKTKKVQIDGPISSFESTVVDENIAEFKRRASLTDYEWAVEKIDNILGKWKFLNGATNDDVEIYRNWILSLKNVEDVDVRIWQNNIQWKYWKNKRWNNIEL